MGARRCAKQIPTRAPCPLEPSAGSGSEARGAHVRIRSRRLTCQLSAWLVHDLQTMRRVSSTTRQASHPQLAPLAEQFLYTYGFIDRPTHDPPEAPTDPYLAVTQCAPPLPQGPLPHFSFATRGAGTRF